MDVNRAFSAYQKAGLCKPFADEVGSRYKSVYQPFQATGLNAPKVGIPLYFSPDPKLDGGNAIIRAVELIDSVTAPSFRYLNEQRDNLAINTGFLSGIFTFANLRREIICSVPLHTIVRRLNSGKLAFFDVSEQVWENCYVTFNDLTGIGANNGIQLIVYYD